MNTSSSFPTENKTVRWTIGVLSVAIPMVVAVLLSLKHGQTLNLGFDTTILPHLNAVFNSLTSLCLIAGFFAIRSKNIALHRSLMGTAFILSSLFLVSYVLYHATVPSTSFGGEGLVRYVYFFLLITHILLAIVVVPLVLWALYYAITKQFERHKKIVKWTFPVWTYVAITGVIVYLMIKPYYG